MLLNQIIAVEKPTKARVQADVTAVYQECQKEKTFAGAVKTYVPLNAEDPDKQPDSRQKVQNRVPTAIAQVTSRLGQLFDITARKDFTNTLAKADVTVDGKVLLRGSPVSYLLFLEKQLVDLRTFADKLPLLPDDEYWTYDPGQGLYVTAPIHQLRTRKEESSLVLVEATDKHPAQTKAIVKDVPAGTWTTIKQSAAITRDERDQILARIEKLQLAVKDARERANMTPEASIEGGAPGAGLLNYVFKGE